jgi:hypothetical protein
LGFVPIFYEPDKIVSTLLDLLLLWVSVIKPICISMCVVKPNVDQL